MVISYIYSSCWRMKLVFYECQQKAPEVQVAKVAKTTGDGTPFRSPAPKPQTNGTP
jgi:hypothetical protein